MFPQTPAVFKGPTYNFKGSTSEGKGRGSGDRRNKGRIASREEEGVRGREMQVEFPPLLQS